MAVQLKAAINREQNAPVSGESALGYNWRVDMDTPRVIYADTEEFGHGCAHNGVVQE